MSKRDRKRGKRKKRCCDKPLRKACKACPRRRPGGQLGRQARQEGSEAEAAGCPLAAVGLL